MKSSHKQYLYHVRTKEPRLFQEGEQITDEWVDTPALCLSESEQTLVDDNEDAPEAVISTEKARPISNSRSTKLVVRKPSKKAKKGGK